MASVKCLLRQTVCENCVSVCKVPKSLSNDSITNLLKKSLRGRIKGVVTVVGENQDRNLTRWVFWLEVTEDVRYLLESLKEDRIEVEGNVFTVTYKRTDPCDIPDEWLKCNFGSGEVQRCFKETEVPTQRPQIFPRSPADKPEYTKRRHWDQQNVLQSQHPLHLPGYFQSTSPDDQIKVGRPNVGLKFEQQQASHELLSNQYCLESTHETGEYTVPVFDPFYYEHLHKKGNGYLHQDHTPEHFAIPSLHQYQQRGNVLTQGRIPQHGGMPSHMTPLRKRPVSYPNMRPSSNAALLGPMIGQNLPQNHIQMHPFIPLEHQHRFFQYVPPFVAPILGVPSHFNPVLGMPGGYNMPVTGPTMPRFTYPQSENTTAGYSTFDVHPHQPCPSGNDGLEHSPNTYDKEELNNGDEEDLHHNKENHTQDERPTRILLSNLPSSTHEEYLEIFFKSLKNFGVTVKNVELDEKTNSAVVEFNNPCTVDLVLGKSPVKMMGQFVDIEVYTPEPLCTIQVNGPPAIMQQLKTLELYFDNERKSSGGNVQHIEYDSEEDVLYVSFETEEIAQRVVEKPTHTVNNTNLHVQLYNPRSNKRKVDNKAKEYKKVVEDTISEEEPVCSVKVKGVKALPSRETFELYFENQKRSGGGEIEAIQTDEEDDDIVYIKYKFEKVARAVAERSHSLEERKLDVSLYVPLPSYDNKVLIKGFNPKTTQDCLSNFTEAKSGFETENMISAKQKDEVMVTAEAHIDFTYGEFEKNFATAKLEGNKIKLAGVSVTDCIIVSGCNDDTNSETIQCYFEKNKRRSGGRAVRKVTMNDDNTCFVNFTGYENRVLDRQHKLNNEMISVRNYQECLALPEEEEMIELAELEIERQTFVDTVTSLKPIETKMFYIRRFPDEMVKELDGLKVKINIEMNEITFQGSLTNVQRAKLKLYELKSRFKFQTVKDISQTKQRLFLSENTKEFIMDKLKSRHVAAAFEVQQSGELVVCYDGDISGDDVTSLVFNAVKESNIAFREESKPLMNSKRWCSRLEEINSLFQGKCNVDVSNELSTVIICATEDILDEVVDCVKRFLYLHTVLVDKVSCARNTHRLIEKHHKSTLNKILKDLHDRCVLVTSLGNYEGFEVFGTQDGIRDARFQLYELLNQIEVCEYTMEMPGLSGHMDTPKGKYSLNTIESMLQCVVTVKKGMLSELAVDVLVNATDYKLSLSRDLGKAQASKGIMPWAPSQGEEIHTRPKTNDNKVTFIISAMSKDIINKAVEKLKSVLEKEVVIKEIKDSIIKKMNDNQLMEIKAIAKNNHLNLTCEEKHGHIEILGIASNVKTASVKIHRIIRDAVTLEQQQNSAKILSNSAFKPPESWADITGNLEVVNVQPGTTEYQSIVQTFTASSGGQFTVNKLERIQNKTLWQQYQAKKKQLENKNTKGTQNERLLWHGTAPTSIDSINAHGFNRSYCGINTVPYGNGVYFAVHASYSCGVYSPPDFNGFKRVYYCRVLTGEYSRGVKGMRVPPQKVGAASSTDLYDSVVDNPVGPSMFIIFNDTQAYPEYLLSFK